MREKNVRKMLKLFMGICLVILLCPLHVKAEEQYTEVDMNVNAFTSCYVNLRTAPNMSASLVGGAVTNFCRAEAPITVLSATSNGWYKVNAGGFVGYIPANVVTTAIERTTDQNGTIVAKHSVRSVVLEPDYKFDSLNVDTSLELSDRVGTYINNCRKEAGLPLFDTYKIAINLLGDDIPYDDNRDATIEQMAQYVLEAIYDDAMIPNANELASFGSGIRIIRGKDGRVRYNIIPKYYFTISGVTILSDFHISRSYYG